MHAIVMREYGGPECLVPAEQPDPVADPGWAVVRLRAAALNWHDVLVRQGRYQSPLPHAGGADGARTAWTGEDGVLPSLWWGDDASARVLLGILGDLARAPPAPGCCAIPASVSCQRAPVVVAEAARAAAGGSTTYRALFSGRLAPGGVATVLRAGGGVATMAVSLAPRRGVHRRGHLVLTGKVSRSRELGASAGVLYGDPSWPQAARELSPGRRGFDVVLDSIGTWQQSIGALRPGGRLVVLGASRAERANLDVRRFYFGQFDLLGTTMGSTRDFAGLLALLDSHDVPPPVIDRTFPLEEAAAAPPILRSELRQGRSQIA